jgi:endo-1,4-beta-mannosidase
MSFVKAVGTKFYLDGEVFKFMGGATYGYYISNAAYLNRVTAAKTAGFNILRFVNFLQVVPYENPPYQTGIGYETTESIWARMDYGLNEARKAGIKILLDLSDLTGIASARGYSFGDANYMALYSDFVAWLAERINTVNGIQYKNDDTIALFSICGEVGNQVAGLAYTTFDTIAGYMKTAGFQQLIHAGGMKPEQIVDSSYGYTNYNPIDILSSTNIDCASTHPYYTQQNMLDLFPQIQAYSVAKNKPWFIEEFGYTGSDVALRVSQYQYVYTTGSTYGSAGFLFWGFDENGTDGYGYTGFVLSQTLTPILYALVVRYVVQFANPSPFVKKLGTQLVYKGKRFRYIGFNSYSFQVDGVSQSTMGNNFDINRRHGCTVVRLWCFDRDNPRRDNNGNLQGTNQPTAILGNFRYLVPASIGTTILSNGTFDTDLSGWSVDAPIFTRSTTGMHSGAGCLAVNAPGGYNNFTTLNNATGITVLPNTDYTLQYWTNLAITGNSQILYVNVGSAYGTAIATDFPSASSGYVQRSVSFNTGSNTKVWIRLTNNGGTVTGFYDDFTLGIKTAPQLGWHEPTLAHLDLLLDEARKRDQKIVLTLFDSNNYQGAAYPSKITYTNWANQIYGLNLNTGDNRTNTATDFFRSPYPRQLLKDFIYGLVNRVNTINGQLYRNDPTIMSWELGNETRFDSDQHEVGQANTDNAVSVNWIIDWIKDITAYIKSIDPNHLTTFGGCEFMSTKVFSSDGALDTWNGGTGIAGDHVYVGSYNGINYKRIAAECPDLDIVSFHMYPNQGRGSGDIHGYGYALGYVYSTRAQGLRAQMRAFIADSKATGKVVEFGEIGYAREDTATVEGWPMYPRVLAFKNVFKEIFDNDGDGLIIWAGTGTGGGSFSVGVGETGRASYWGNNENSNDSEIGHIINGLNTSLVDPGKRPRSV